MGGLVFLVALAGVGALLWFKVIKKKLDKKGVDIKNDSWEVIWDKLNKEPEVNPEDLEKFKDLLKSRFDQIGDVVSHDAVVADLKEVVKTAVENDNK